jgi:predicted ABC-type ATPase
MRVFAGPNGSGKTTIFNSMLNQNKVNLGVFVNADEIESTLKLYASINFADFQLNITNDQLKSFFQNSNFSPTKRSEPDLFTKIQVANNIFTTTAALDSYLAADLSEFLRQQLLANNISFTYETVMSHYDKITFFEKALQNGYRV